MLSLEMIGTLILNAESGHPMVSRVNVFKKIQHHHRSSLSLPVIFWIT